MKPRLTASRLTRRRDALRHLERALEAHDRGDCQGMSAALLDFKITYALGYINESRGYHARRPKGSSRYSDSDARTLEWIEEERERTGIKAFAKLVDRAIAAGVASGDRASLIRRLRQKRK